MLENTAIVLVGASWQHGDVSETFGARVKRLMLAKGWIPAELARRSGLSPTQISRFTTDKRGERPEWEKTVKPLAGALGVTPTYLLDGIEENAAASKGTLAAALMGRNYSMHVRAYAFQMADLFNTFAVEEIRKVLDVEEMNVRKPPIPDPYPERAKALQELLMRGAPNDLEQRAIAYIVKHPQYDQVAEFSANGSDFWLTQYERALAIYRGTDLQSRHHEQRSKDQDAKMHQKKRRKPRKKPGLASAKKRSA